MTTIEFNKKCICNGEFVSIKIIDNCEQLKIGNIWVPSTSSSNDRLAFGILENVGVDAAKEYGLKVGDYVLFDRLSTFYHTAPICVCKYNNVICLTSEDKSEYKPLKNMLFVELPKEDSVVCEKGIYIPSESKKLKIGTIVDINFDEENSNKIDVKVGDHVLMTKGGDHVQIGDRSIVIYKHDMLICKVED